MFLTTKSKYAIMAMADLATHIVNNQKTKRVSLHEIAQKQKISLAYLEQIFAKLKHAGLVASFKGPLGGYEFVKNIDQITLLEIIRAVKENIKMTNCGECKAMGRIKEPGIHCERHIVWKMLTQHIERFFGNITLEDVVNNKFKLTY